MRNLFHDLATAQRSLDDALAQLRDQQELASLARDARNHGALIVLLSNGLRQFYKIEKHRNGLLETLSGTLSQLTGPAPPNAGALLPKAAT